MPEKSLFLRHIGDDPAFAVRVRHPAPKSAEKAVCGSVFLTKWHCIFNKNSLLQGYSLAILPAGGWCSALLQIFLVFILEQFLGVYLFTLLHKKHVHAQI